MNKRDDLTCSCCGMETIPPGPGEEGYYCEGCGSAWVDPQDTPWMSCMLHRAAPGPIGGTRTDRKELHTMSTTHARNLTPGDRFRDREDVWTVDQVEELIDGRTHVLTHDDDCANVSWYFNRDAVVEIVLGTA